MFDFTRKITRTKLEEFANLMIDAKDRFRKKRDKAIDEYNALLEESNLSEPINDFLNR